MPQLDLSTFASQLFWLVVFFVVLYAVLSRVAIPRIAGVLDERERRIADNRERAEKLVAEAKAAEAAYEKLLADARNEAQGILRSAAEDSARRAEERQHELGERLAAQIKAAEERIAASKGEALAEVRAVAAGLASDVAGRLAGIAVDEAAAAAAVAATAGEPG